MIVWQYSHLKEVFSDSNNISLHDINQKILAKKKKKKKKKAYFQILR